MKLQLILPPVKTLSDYGLRRWMQPLGLLYIASFAKSKIPSLDIELLDGTLLGYEDICKKIGGDLVAFSTVMRNYESTLKMAAIAKTRGSKVILGGPHATFLSNVILKNRDDVDAVVRYDGEMPIYEILKGKKFVDIDNLVYRDENQKIIKNNISSININSLPYPYRNVEALEEYLKNFKKETNSAFKSGINIISQRGCKWKTKSGGCTFCAIANTRWRPRKIDNFWEEIMLLHKDFEIDFFFDVSENIASSTSWLDLLERRRPPELRNTGFRFYITAECITSKNIEILKKLNCSQLFIGFESFCSEQLKLINKGATVYNNFEAINKLKISKINFIPSFILGLPNETFKVASKNLKIATALSHYENCDDIHWSLFKPIPGTSAFHHLMSDNKIKRKYIGKDIFNEEELIWDWIRTQTCLDRDCINLLSEKYNAIRPRDKIFYKPAIPSIAITASKR